MLPGFFGRCYTGEGPVSRERARRGPIGPRIGRRSHLIEAALASRLDMGAWYGDRRATRGNSEMTYVWIGLALVVVVVGVAHRVRMRSRKGRGTLSEEEIRRIEETGSIERPEEGPLDLDEIERAEDEFWEETWDEPDPW